MVDGNIGRPCCVLYEIGPEGTPAVELYRLVFTPSTTVAGGYNWTGF